MDVQLKQKPEVRLAAVRHTGPYHTIGEAFTRLDAGVRASGGPAPGAQLVGVFHDDPRSTPPDRLRSDAGISIAEGATLPKDTAEQRLPAGKYACAVHIGPYEKLGDAWKRLTGEWLPASGHRAAPGPTYEVYLNTPMDEPDARKLRTELCVPITSD